MNVVVLLAGGVGSRMGANVPKQHVKIYNHQIIEYTLTAFSSVKIVDAILVVSNEAFLSEVEKLKVNFKKLKWVIPGGATRIFSVYNAVKLLKTICNDTDKIVISDAARPCIRVSETTKVIYALNKYNAVTTGVEVYETILKTSNEEITDIIQREGVLRQTSPEGYTFEMLRDLYIRKDESIIRSYKNIGLEQMKDRGIPIGIVKTSPLNFKITTSEDIYLFETVLRQGFEKYIIDTE